MVELNRKIKQLPGPIIIIGASGFIGSNILHSVRSNRDDVLGTVFSGGSWRLKNVPTSNLIYLNLHDKFSIQSVFQRYKPKTIFDCSSFGAYSFEQDFERIHSTNYLSFVSLIEQIRSTNFTSYIHAGSSSEYGLNAAGPKETSPLFPNSHYATSKAAASQAIAYFGKLQKIPIVNLRLYSVYGPYEDSSRLISVLCENSIKGKLPIFADPNISRDFIFINDVVSAFVDAALHMNPEIAGESFNIGTGVQTSLLSLANTAKDLFNIKDEPVFNAEFGRTWDVNNWYSDPEKAKELLGWSAKTKLKEGLHETQKWWKQHLALNDFSLLTKKKNNRKLRNSITAVVACYKDEQAIPVMHERLVNVFKKLEMDYEIIFVNDCSPDNTLNVIKEISSFDPNVIGINHSRNFGSQAAFRSGMELANKEACVLLDGDLQDPPELIEDFVVKWREGADVVYGVRVKRDMPVLLEFCYRAFYRLFSALSEVPIPKNAGDFSLIDRSVIYWILQCGERDSFLRGLRAYVGFKQVGVNYVRPERLFGVSTNNIFKNIGWAKKGIFSFSRLPLHALSAFGCVAFAATVVLACINITIKLFFPNQAPPGITFLSLLVMGFGSCTILGLGLLGEYIGKILEETKARPRFIRSSLILKGEVKPADLNGEHN